MSDTKYLNKNIFEKVLKNKEKQDVEVKDFKVSAAVKKGENYMSDIYRVDLDYVVNGESKNCSVIAKYMITRGDLYTLVEEYAIAVKEKKMYLEILPKMYEMTGVKFGPECYYITEDDIVFFFEDLKASGFEMADRLAGMSSGLVQQCLDGRMNLLWPF